MKPIRLLSLLLCSLMAVGALRAQWPPATPEAKAGTRWWWLGSAVDEQNLRWNLRQYASHGLGAVEITPLYGVKGNEANNIPFLSPQWMQMLRVCQQVGEETGIQIDMNCGTGWPFGGPEVPIEEAACKVVLVDTIVSASEADRLQLQAPRRERPHARLVVQRAFPTADPAARRVIALFESRTLQRVKRAAPGGEGWVIDHFDSTAVAHYLQRFDAAFAATQTPWPSTFFNDSYEVYGADWTPTLLDEFVRRRGYSLEDHLPEFVDGEPRVVADYRETLSDLLLKNFTEQWTAWAHSHGVRVRNQAHGSPANLIDVYAAVDIPEIEGFGLTDFGIRGLRTDPGMTRPNYSDLSMLKYAPSAAHITGKRLTSSETFTWLTEHFRTSLSQMKPDLDLMFCAGVNRVFFHGTCYSPQDDPWPGWRFYASVDMSPTNTIWRDAPYLMQYIERCQRFLQWGEPDNDFLVYLPVRDMWQRDTRHRLMQFDIHSMAQKAPDFIRAILTIDSSGFDCDYTSERYLLTTTCEGGLLRTAAGTRYRALIIPGDCLMTAEVEAHIAALQAKGAHIIRQLSAATLSEAASPEAMKSQLHLKMIRRSHDGGYHYFIANLTPSDVDAMVPLAVAANEAMWYNPMTDETAPATIADGRLHVDLRSGESRILLLSVSSTSTASSALAASSSLQPRQTSPSSGSTGSSTVSNASRLSIPLSHGWRLSFIESTPVVERSYSIDSLRTWETLDEQTAQLMGTGVYECDFRLTAKAIKHSTWQIDLGDVRESARVYINGHAIGCAWAVPFVLDVPQDVLRKGKNHIRIEVTNLPANRITHLDRQQVPWRKFEEINVVDINYRPTTYAHWSPVPSGLNAVVRLIAY